MSSQRVQYGYCSFVPPEGFVIQDKASFVGSDSVNGAELLDGRKSPLCITLSSTAVHPDVLDFSESPEDMNPDAYPVTLTLNTFVAHFTASALDYLRNASEELKKHFTDFRTDFCQETTVGEFPAARSQFSYVTNFRIFQLHYAWLADAVLVTTTMTVTESGVEKGWADLRNFVESVTI
ncbi:MAG: hypothetical protein GWN86_31025 [Desulfobacterales bacterium]|nr:hypothetical protein [Desulfobacterales bacterium]